MYMNPYLASKLDHDRHRDMRADVGQHRPARQLRDPAITTQPTDRTPHRPHRTWRSALRLRARAHA
jgi:hypothetical protein